MTADPRWMRVVRAAIAAEHHVAGRQREVVGVVFADPEEIHADLVGKHALLDDVADRLGMRQRAVFVVVSDVAKGVEAED